MFKVNNTCNFNMFWCRFYCQVVKKKKKDSVSIYRIVSGLWQSVRMREEKKAGLTSHSPVGLNHGTCKSQDRGGLIQGHLGLGMQTNGLTNCSKGSCDWAWSQHTSANKVFQLGTVTMPSSSARACERAAFDFWSNPLKIFAMGPWKSPL